MSADADTTDANVTIVNVERGYPDDAPTGPADVAQRWTVTLEGPEGRATVPFGGGSAVPAPQVGDPDSAARILSCVIDDTRVWAVECDGERERDALARLMDRFGYDDVREAGRVYDGLKASRESLADVLGEDRAQTVVDVHDPAEDVADRLTGGD